MRVICRLLDWDLTAADVLRLVREDRHPVALLGAWGGGCDIVAAGPVRVSEEPAAPDCEGQFPVAGRGGAGFGGGWIGYLGFGATHGLLSAPGEPRRLPRSWHGYYDHVLRRDRATGRWTFEALAVSSRTDALEFRLAELCRRAAVLAPAPRPYSCGEFGLIPSPREHQAAVRETVSYIRRGDLFQANICLRLEAGFDGDPLDAFCDAAARLDPPYAAFLRVPGGAVASLSPELFLRRTGTRVLSQPIKGTAPRAADPAAAAGQREALEHSAKDQAENVMIVDLMRNDLSRVCVPGSVTVPRMLHTQAHPGVWHLVSDVTGTLRPGTSDAQLIAATFPPGSVTGAPKVRALEIICEQEATPREVYTGAIGYRSPLAGLELNVAIRTFEFHAGRVWLGSGGGITARSDPAAEYRECLVKAAPLIRALGGTLSQAAIPARPQPRPARGVFTSLRVTGGAVHDLDAHLARLDASARELFGKPLPPDLPAELSACLARRPSGRLRITARPVGGPLQATVEVVPAGTTPATVALHPVTVPGGLGAHKWQDRRLVDQAREHAGLGPDEHLLLLSEAGYVLETDRASVFAVIGGVLRTPPADGRLLPGVSRAAVLRLARQVGIPAAETPVSLPELRQATEVFVTNSVHGIMPARSLAPARAGDTDEGLAGRGQADAGTSWPTGPVADRLRTALAGQPGPAGVASGPAPSSAAARQAPRRGDRPLLILIDNYDSFTYNLAHLLLRHGARVEVIRNDEIPAGQLAACAPDGVVISPGPGTPADAGISVATVRACGTRTPLLGICLGHQAIAAAYGATITTAPHPVHGQTSPITHDGRGLLAGLPQPFPAARYHSLIVAEDTLPPDLLITARGPGGIPMGLRHARHPAEGLQFHPESILTACGGLIIGNFIRAVRSASARSLAPPRPPRCFRFRQRAIRPGGPAFRPDRRSAAGRLYPAAA